MCKPGEHGPFEHQVVQATFEGRIETIAMATCIKCGDSATGFDVGGIMTAHNDDEDGQDGSK